VVESLYCWRVGVGEWGVLEARQAVDAFRLLQFESVLLEWGSDGELEWGSGGVLPEMEPDSRLILQSSIPPILHSSNPPIYSPKSISPPVSL
jgi:hypothetical protein